MFNINRVIKTLIYFDILGSSAVGFFTPVFAIFVLQDIEGGSVKVVGFAWAVYWVVKSILQLVVARYLDSTKGENDDIFSLITGSFLLSGILFLYAFVNSVSELYLLQALLAFASALIIPPWYAVFTRHVDKFKIGEEWAMDSTGLGLGIALAGALSGLAVDEFGFRFIFIVAGTLHFCATLFLLPLSRVIKKDGDSIVIPERKNY